MTFRRLWAVLAVLLPVLGALIAGLSSTDLTYHLRAGAQILDGAGIPRVDTWTYTVAGRPWLDQQWLAQVVLEAVYRIGSWTGLVLLRAALVGFIFGGIALGAVRRGADVRVATALAVLAFFVAAPALALRPQLFGMALFVALLLLGDERHRRPSWLWLAVPILAVWANVHGSFVLAFVLLGLAWLEDVVSPADAVPRGRFGRHGVLVIALAAAAATLLNPWGPEVWAYASGLAMDRTVTTRVSEWQQTTLRDVPGILFYMSALAVVAVLARCGRVVPWPSLLLLGGFFVLGAYAVRGMAWWPLVAAVVVGGLLARERDLPEAVTTPAARRLNLAVAAVLTLACVALLPVWRPIDRGLGTPILVVGQAPSGITAGLRDVVVPGDRLLAPQVWGSWFEWTFPQATVAVDSRIELFPAEVWDAYDTVLAGRDGWEQQLQDWGVTIVVAAGDGAAALADRLSRRGWVQRHADGDGIVLTPAGR